MNIATDTTIETVSGTLDHSAYLDSEIKSKILELVNTKDNVKRGDIVSVLPRVEPHRITLILTKMVKDNEIQRFGMKRGTFYRKNA